MSGQAVRDRLVPAFLDITAGDWRRWVQSLSDDDVVALERNGWDVYVVRVIESLEASAIDPDARGDYLQVMAQLADDTMRDLVRRCSGRDPLEGEVPA